MKKGKPSSPLSSATAPKLDPQRGRTKRHSEPLPSGSNELREHENASGPRVPKSLSSGSPGRGRR